MLKDSLLSIFRYKEETNWAEILHHTETEVGDWNKLSRAFPAPTFSMLTPQMSLQWDGLWRWSATLLLNSTSDCVGQVQGILTEVLLVVPNILPRVCWWHLYDVTWQINNNNHNWYFTDVGLLESCQTYYTTGFQCLVKDTATWESNWSPLGWTKTALPTELSCSHWVPSKSGCVIINDDKIR